MAREKYYTRKSLADYLNKKYKRKSFSSKHLKNRKSVFTPQDITQYIKTGKLPDKYGGYKIEKSDFNGARMVKVYGEDK